ncbi:putative autophagy-related protein 11 [Gordionus sp. m RMFG-2023]|uniref:putative autophagy-related protein 11 n=1 Tax=Gordionus sp. m RMFG-2023 TaxID=3053472 RepID=UPI0031FDE648
MLHEQQIVEYSKYISKLKALYSKQIKSINDDKQSTILKLNQEIHQQKKCSYEMTNIIENLQTKLSNFLKKIDNYELEINKFNRNEVHLHRLKTENKDIIEKNTNLQSSIESLNMELQKSQKNVKNQNDINFEMNSKLKHLHEENEEFKHQISVLNHKLNLKDLQNKNELSISNENLIRQNNELLIQNEALKNKIQKHERIDNKEIDDLLQQKYKLKIDTLRLEIENKAKYEVDTLKRENDTINKEMEVLNDIMSQQRQKWERESKHLQNTLDCIECEKSELIKSTKECVMRDKRKLFDIIRNLQKKLVTERSNKCKLMSIFRKKISQREHTLNNVTSKLNDENKELRISLTQVQQKLAVLINQNKNLGTEFINIARQNKQGFQIDIREKEDKIFNLQKDLHKFQDELNLKCDEYKKKKQIYCKIIVKLRNQVKKLQYHTRTNTQITRNANPINSNTFKDKVDIYAKKPINLHMKELPVGDKVFYTLP